MTPQTERPMALADVFAIEFMGYGASSERCKSARAALLAALQEQAREGEAVAWRTEAVKWIRRKAEEQRATNEQYPRHAEAYPSWVENVRQLHRLADDLECEQESAPFGIDTPVVAAPQPAQPEQGEPLDRSDAVNLARNISDNDSDDITHAGVKILCDAVLRMDAALQSAQLTKYDELRAEHETLVYDNKILRDRLIAQEQHTNPVFSQNQAEVTDKSAQPEQGELIARLRETASKGVSVWGDLQMEAAKEIEILTAERELYASAMDRMQSAQPVAQPLPLTPEWIVNDLGELGVNVGGRFFFLYKGDNIEYGASGIGDSSGGIALHDDGTPMKYRTVGKREFGETCMPLKWIMNNRSERRYTEELVFTPGLSFGKPEDGAWRELPGIGSAR